MLQTLSLMQRMVKIPPLKALSLFNSSTMEEGFQHTHHSISFTFHLLVSSNLLSHAESLLLQLLSGRISSPYFTPSSLIHQFTQPSSSSLNSNSVLYETIINAYIQSQLPKQALFYFNQMINRGLVPSSNTYNNLLKNLLKSNDFEIAWWVFNNTKDKVQLDAYSFGIMIKGCCNVGDMSKSFEILSQLEDLGWPPNVVMYTTLIDGCCKNGDIDAAKKMLSKMEGLGILANQYTYTVLINGLFKQGLKKEGFELYEKMKINGVAPNVYTYNSMIHLYCNDGKITNAFQLFDEMLERKVSCNDVTYNTLINGLCKEKMVMEAEKLMEKMKKTGLNPNIVTYNTIIDGFCNVGKLEKASNYFDELKSSGQSPTLITYNVMISGFSKAGYLGKIGNIVREMEGRGITPCKVTYTILIDSYVRSNNMEKAFELYSSMGKMGLIPDIYTYGVLINGLCSVGNMKEALKMFNSVKLEANDVLYNTMINGYCKEEGSCYRAIWLIKEMKEKKMVPNIASYSSTIEAVCKDGKVKEAQILVEKMVKYGLKPPVSVQKLLKLNYGFEKSLG